MLKHILILSFVGAIGVPFGVTVDGPPSVLRCSSPGSKIGPCPEISGQFSGGGVDLGANEEIRGSGGTGGTGRTGGPGGAAAPDPSVWNEEAARARGNFREAFQVISPPAPPAAVTINDLASFAPGVDGNHMQPNGWIVVGLHTNFYADRATRVVDGSLLGLPAVVRFTPVSWTWSFGDGSALASATPGASWAAQGLGEFEPTATSHVFTSPGSYAIDLTVEYRAEYQFAGSGWVPVAGTLDLPANRIIATASDADTVLVARDCRQNPEGPGC